MTERVERRLRDPAERAGAPEPLAGLICERVRHEPQVAESEGFEMRRFGPTAALVLVVAVAAALMSRSPSPPPAQPSEPLSSVLGDELDRFAARAEAPYRAELAGILADAACLFDMAASGLRRAGGLE